MKVAVTGATGLIGSALVKFLEGNEYEIVSLRRSSTEIDFIKTWNPLDATFSDGAMDGVDAIVHLAGENIASRRWTKEQKTRIRDSRINGTRHLAEALANLKHPPKTFIVASAIGFYGDRGDEHVDESSSVGSGFLAETCQSWEQAAAPARAIGIRVVNLRIGVVLTPTGGALGQMLLPFKIGVGGVIGSGRQYMSWVALDDVLTSVLHVLRMNHLSGVVNVVAPGVVTNGEFTKILGKVLRRPTLFPVPAVVVRLIFGEMADELLLSSTYVRPGQLQETGFVFDHPTLEGALRHLLGRAV